MTFARVNPTGWNFRDPLLHTQANQLDINVSRALDGYSGGTYNPSALLTWNNQWIVDATLGTGANLVGIQGTGKGTGSGLKGIGGTNGAGVDGIGTGTGSGVKGTGGATDGIGVEGTGSGAGVGIHGQGGSSNAIGVHGVGGGWAMGGLFDGGSTSSLGGHGAKGQGGTPASTGSGGIGLIGAGGDGKTTSDGGRGVYGYGGSSPSGTGGEGVRGLGGANDGIGVHGIGDGSGHGGYFVNSSTGYGLVAEGKSATPTKAAFRITPQAASPSSLDDGAMWFVGDDAWARIDGRSRPIAPCRCYALVYDDTVPSLLEGYNVASVSYPGAQFLRITFTTAFTDANYVVVVGTEAVASILVQVALKTTTYVELQHIDTTTGAVLSWGITNCTVSAAIFGGELA